MKITALFCKTGSNRFNCRNAILVIFKRKFTVYAPGANSVKLVGAFNNWSQDEDSLLERDEYGVWYKEMDLAPGVYQYKFLIDDTWEEDQYNPYFVKDAFGGKNSIVEVKEEG